MPGNLVHEGFCSWNTSTNGGWNIVNNKLTPTAVGSNIGGIQVQSSQGVSNFKCIFCSIGSWRVGKGLKNKVTTCSNPCIAELGGFRHSGIDGLKYSFRAEI